MSLQEQPARILSLLVSRPGELVTREELRQLVWTNETFVEFDASLNAAITKVRRALGDSASAPRFIETVPKRGYRFLADVQGLPPAHGAVSGSSAVALPAAVADSPAASPPDVGRGRRTALPGVVAVALLSGWLLSPGPAKQSAAPVVRSLTVQPFELRAGEMHPNLGSELAVAIGRRLGRLHTLTVKPWPPGATADPRALSRELGVDARLSGAPREPASSSRSRCVSCPPTASACSGKMPSRCPSAIRCGWNHRLPSGSRRRSTCR